MPTAMLDLPERVLVTGAAGGIGAAIVFQLATSGVSVVATDLTAAPAEHSAKTWIQADLSTAEGRAAVVQACGGRLDGVVHTAGVIDPADWQNVTEDAFDQIMTVNVKAPFFLLRALLPILSTDAAAVLLGSASAMRGSPLTPLYSASKAALHHLAASLALALAPRRIRVNVVAPGMVDTPLTDGLNRRMASERGVDAEVVGAERAAAIPLGRAASPGEIAQACLHLLSPQASYTTGATLYPTGGVLAGAI